MNRFDRSSYGLWAHRASSAPHRLFVFLYFSKYSILFLVYCKYIYAVTAGLR